MIRPEFLLTSLVVVLIPGAGVIRTEPGGLIRRRRARVRAGRGCAAGILAPLAATTRGPAVLMHASALAFQAPGFTGPGPRLALRDR